MRNKIKYILGIVFASLCVEVSAVPVNLAVENKTFTASGSAISSYVDIFVTNVAGAPDLSGYSIHMTHSATPGFQFTVPWGTTASTSLPHPMIFTDPVVYVQSPYVPVNSDAQNIYAMGYDNIHLEGLPMTENGGLLRAYFMIDANLTGTWDISIDTSNTSLYGFNENSQDNPFPAFPYNALNGRITVLGGANAVPAPAAVVGGLPLLGVLVAMKFIRRRKTK